jgi:pre-mRNA-splicing factor ATP-dependent RNA helicase DHX38/PRP16
VYVSTVTAVDPHWLADLGGVFYSIKEKGYSARHKRIVESEFNRKMEIEAKMAEDKAREEERLLAEEERAKKKTTNGPGGHGDKKFITQGAVKKPVVKRRGRGF